jgi:hypothetical protein
VDRTAATYSRVRFRRRTPVHAKMWFLDEAPLQQGCARPTTFGARRLSHPRMWSNELRRTRPHIDLGSWSLLVALRQIGRDAGSRPCSGRKAINMRPDAPAIRMSSAEESHRWTVVVRFQPISFERLQEHLPNGLCSIEPTCPDPWKPRLPLLQLYTTHDRANNCQ